MSFLTNFTNELQRRRVVSTATIYIVAAWLVVQVADTAFPGMNIPEEAIRYVWIAAIIGLPIALIFGWIFDITAHGISRTPPLDAEGATDLSLRVGDYLTLGTLGALVIAIIIVMASEISRVEPSDGYDLAARDVNPYSIAVLPLANLTGDPEQDYLVDGLHDALITDLEAVTEKATSEGAK